VRVLHLLANHKWTGAAEPALQVLRRLHGSPLPSGGACEVRLAVAGFVHAGMEHAVRERAESLGIPTLEGLSLRKHVRPVSLVSDAYRLRELAEEEGFDLLHCHLPADHLTAALAVSAFGLRLPIVRSDWEIRPPSFGPRNHFSFEVTAGLHCWLEERARVLERRFSFPPARVAVLPPPLDPTLPSLAGRPEGGAFRERFGIPPEAPLLGITARIQRRRRWPLLFEAFARIRERLEGARLCVLGRPDEGVFEELCRRPLAAAGLLPYVHFPGYLRGADYAAALRAFDLFLFLVPGSDPTCRALREAMLFGLPVLCTDAGSLPALVEDGRTGRVVPPSPEALAGAALDLLADSARARLLAEEGARLARAQAKGGDLVRGLLRLYRAVLEERGS